MQQSSKTIISLLFREPNETWETITISSWYTIKLCNLILLDIPDKYLEIFEAKKKLPVLKLSSSTNIDSSEQDLVKCRCGIEAVERITKKEGPNNGRKFYSCVQRQCNFFQWKDQLQQKTVYMVKVEPSMSNNSIHQITRDDIVKKEKTISNTVNHSTSVHKSNFASRNFAQQNTKETKTVSSTVKTVKKEQYLGNNDAYHLAQRQVNSEPVIISDSEEETSPKKRQSETGTSHLQIKKKRKQFL